MKGPPLPIHAQHGDSRLGQNENDGFISNRRGSQTWRELHRPLTVAPWILMLIWHHRPKGTWKAEVNADWPFSPSIWTWN